MARRPRTNKTEHRVVKALDDLAEFERYQEEVMPILRRAVSEGWTPERIQAHPKIQAMITARQIGIALMEKDSGRALGAITDLRNRGEGKPKEKLELSGKLEKLTDEQLDSLLITQLKDIAPSEDDETSEPHH